MKICIVFLLIVSTTASEKSEIIVDELEALARASVTIILEFHALQSNTIFVIKSGSRKFDLNYAAILTYICARVDQTLAITFQINENVMQHGCCKERFSNNIILVYSYESFRYDFFVM